MEEQLSRESEVRMWQCLFTSSVTINIIVLTILFTQWIIKMVMRWRRTRKIVSKDVDISLENFVHKNRTYLAAMLVDLILAIGLFAGGFYILIGGSVVTQTLTDQPGWSKITAIGSTLFTIAIGRLSVSFVFGIKRLHMITSASCASLSLMQCIDHLVALISLIVIVTHNEDFLTGAFILIMCIDSNVYILSFLIDKLEASHLDKFRVCLKVLQCFLSMAFRCAVPLVCLTLSLVVKSYHLMSMKPGSITIVVASAIFYLTYNIWIIFMGIKSLWSACLKHKQQQQQKTSDTGFFINNKQTVIKNPLEFNINKTEVKVNQLHVSHIPANIKSQTDLDSYIDDNIPPAYGNYRRLPRASPYFRPSLQTPCQQHSVIPSKPCSNLNLCPVDQNVEKKTMKPIKLKAGSGRHSHVSPNSSTFMQDLPTITEEAGSFKDIDISD